MPINHVGPTLAKRDTGKRLVGITLAYAGLVGLRALDQHRTNGWQLSWPDEQYDIGLTSTSGQQNCRQNASVGPTNDCYLGCPLDATSFSIVQYASIGTPHLELIKITLYTI